MLLNYENIKYDSLFYLLFYIVFLTLKNT